MGHGFTMKSHLCMEAQLPFFTIGRVAIFYWLPQFLFDLPEHAASFLWQMYHSSVYILLAIEKKLAKNALLPCSSCFPHYVLSLPFVHWCIEVQQIPMLVFRISNLVFIVKVEDAWLADDDRWDPDDTRMYFKLLRLPGQAPLPPMQVCRVS